MSATTDAPRIKLISKGNAKLGPNIWHTNLPAGESCPGRSDWCSATDGGACYAGKGFYVLQREKYARQLQLLENDPQAFSAMLQIELVKLPAGAVFRFHTSGDIASLP